MATDAVTASDLPQEEAYAEPPPAGEVAASLYGPSWVDRLISWMEDVPGPTWLAYLALAAVLMAGAAGLVMLRSVPDLDVALANVFWGAIIPLAIWLAGHLARVAGSAFDAFRPLLGVPDPEADRMRHGLTVIPPRPALAILVLMAVFTPLYWLADPAGSAVVGMTQVELVARFFSETLFGALLIVLAYQTVRQLRAVDRIHAAAARIDLFRPAPLYAFSALTSRAAIVLALLFIVPTAVAGGIAGNVGTLWLFYAFAAVGVVLALVVFVAPLLGMRRRIVAEKQRLQAAAGKRLAATIASVHAAIDRDDLPAASGMRDALEALIAERNLVDHLPTFPWRPGTLGAVVGAILVPLMLSLASRLIERAI